ncbi:hypothetical protein NHX12_021692 [Muraenolepis orangiensis]|uniref:FAM69 protein-kinase domain-containing protein n=1 Tax=Muraenolepis orangiensis TaxID=630683 RepID=A0A9Q0ESL0_9TELE|nr:hypothetical protein NHX12_021692 [Muraenolepis orangiensis]
MCADLCVRELVQYKGCLYYDNGKKVMEARWRELPVILKSKLENFSSYEPLAILDYQETTDDLSPLDVVFYATLEVRNSLDKPYSRAELASLWALLQQEEYTFLRVLQDLSSHVAKVLGSCGHFYAVEYLSAGHAWDQNLFPLDRASVRGPPGPAGPWTSRDKVHRIALSFLDMVWHFDNDFTHKLHLCDVKPENFAIRTDLTVSGVCGTSLKLP